MNPKLPSSYSVAEYKGTPRACGQDYGAAQAELIRAFLLKEVAPSRTRLNYARRCWRILSEWEQPVVEFMCGLSLGSGLTLEETTLLLAHEEIVHTKHCTALGATRAGTADGTPIIGQNWDWAPSLYPWSSLLRLQTDAMPATLTYAYPGLWASAGINELGLSLVWTGAGYLPKVPPVVGVPTYALIAGILACGTCRAAIELVRRTPIAGSFIFFIGDAGGEIWVLEGTAGKVVAVECADVIGRANHFECDSICRLAKQDIPPDGPAVNTGARRRRLQQLLEKYRGHLDSVAMEAILSDHGRRTGLSICQHPTPAREGMTIDSFYMLPTRKELWIARGHQCRHRYEGYTV